MKKKRRRIRKRRRRTMKIGKETRRQKPGYAGREAKEDRIVEKKATEVIDMRMMNSKSKRKRKR